MTRPSHEDAGDSLGRRYDRDVAPSGEIDAQEHDLWGMSTEPADGAAPLRRHHGRPEWLAPAFIIALAVCAFAGAWAMTRGGGPAHTPQAPLPVAPSTTAPDPTAADPSPSATPNSSDTPSTSSPTPTTAAFPADAVATCGGGQPLTDPSVRLAPGTASSCSYVLAAAQAVRAELAGRPSATSFTITPYSALLKRTVALSCTRTAHLSECVGGNDVHLWVRDAVG